MAGLGLAAVMACALFAAISGSSPATVVAIGSILLPAMVQAGYPKRFGAGVIATSGALGILIPPSIVMVLYAVATGGSVAIDPEGKRVLSASVGATVHGRRHPRPDPRLPARHDHILSRLEEQLSAHAKGDVVWKR